MLPDFLLPYNAVDTRNPVFRHLWSHVRGLNTLSCFRRFTQTALIALPLVSLLLWSLQRLNQLDANGFTHLLLEAAVAVMLITSLYSLPRVLGRFSAQFHSAYWETLRLTPLYNSAILMAHDAIAQLHLWPLTVLEVSLRIAIVILYVADSFYTTAAVYPQASELVTHTLLSPSYLSNWGIKLCAAIALILEPVFRVRLIVALHLWIAFRIHEMPFLLLIGFAALSLFHFVQLLVMLALLGLFQAFNRQEAYTVSNIICLLPLSGLSIGLFWALYHRLRQAALKLTYDWAFRQD